MKRVTELSREQLTELKANYLVQLADCGEFAEIVGRDYDAPTYEDMLNADDIISDTDIMEHWEGTMFSDDDFFCTASK